MTVVRVVACLLVTGGWGYVLGVRHGARSQRVRAFVDDLFPD